MWSITVNGTAVDLSYPTDLTKMEIELDLRIQYGLHARLDIKWIPPVQEERHGLSTEA